jgi:hypothetical protein
MHNKQDPNFVSGPRADKEKKEPDNTFVPSAIRTHC